MAGDAAQDDKLPRVAENDPDTPRAMAIRACIPRVAGQGGATLKGRVMRYLDYPPVWLVAALGLAWAQAALLPVPGVETLHAVGTVVALTGGALMLLAAPEFLRARTTIVPHRAPDALITGGLYRLSRNPIYLADALILAGLCLRWGAWPSLVLVPVFIWIITRRFIEPEEARLHAAFGTSYAAYRARVRRWV
jgi:protein-S-isoprenylcysteine O-methyltransferase Ste14